VTPDSLFSIAIAREPWQRDAACREHPEPGLWFPERGQATAAALEVCAGCLVREECLEYALEHDIRDGIWGGQTWSERRRIVGLRPAQANRSLSQTPQANASRDHLVVDGSSPADAIGNRNPLCSNGSPS
jgi:WhiB family redox-sensing transcriptional regulator